MNGHSDIIGKLKDILLKNCSRYSFGAGAAKSHINRWCYVRAEGITVTESSNVDASQVFNGNRIDKLRVGYQKESDSRVQDKIERPLSIYRKFNDH
jgi:hypothetical protein